jgi:glycosyltransferase involved in cell wall biosynthesis
LNKNVVDFFPLMRTSLDKFNRRVIPFKTRVLPRLWFYRPDLLSIGAPVYTHDVELTLPFLYPAKAVPVVMTRHELGGFVQHSLYRHALFKKFFLAWEAWTIRRIDRLILVSAEALQYYTERYREHAHKFIHIPNGVDLTLFRRQCEADVRREWGITDGRVVVLHVARLTSAKDQGLLLRTFVQIKKKCPEAVLMISGSGEEAEKLSSIVRDESIADVRFLGELPHCKLPSLYSAADVFLLTSSWEGMPMVILEALSCGVPVVSTRVGAVPSVIENGKCGFICDSRDATTLAKATLLAANRRKDMQARCLSVAHSFSAEAMSAKIFQIFDGLVRTR